MKKLSVLILFLAVFAGGVKSVQASYPSADYTVQVTVTDLRPAPEYSYLVGRVQDQNTFYVLRLSEDDAYIMVNNGGAWSNLAGSFTSPQDGDTVALKFIGTTIQALYNGEIVQSVTDSTIVDAGTAGLGVGAGINNQWDGTMGSQQIDDFKVIVSGVTIGEDSFTTDSTSQIQDHSPDVGQSWTRLWRGTYAPPPPVSFHISQRNLAGEFEEKWVEHYQPQYETRRVPISADSQDLTLRIEQRDLDYGDIDYLAIEACGETIKPTRAILLANSQDVKAQVTAIDHEVVGVHNQPAEVTFALPENCLGEVSLIMNAHEYGSNFAPLSYPELDQFTTYGFGNDQKIEVDGWLNETEERAPQEVFWWAPSTGHPPGYTYLYLSHDEDYVYIQADVTTDNTDEWGKDWIQIDAVLTDGTRIGSYRVTDLDQRYGKCLFGMTDKVSYRHQTCELRIPRQELPSNRLNYRLSYYGTAGGDPMLIVDASNDWVRVQDGNTSWGEMNILNEASEAVGPVITGEAATVTTNGATITWETDEPASSQVEYGDTDEYGSITDPADTGILVSNHSIQISGLTACTSYHFRVLSQDVWGNQSAGEDQALTTNCESQSQNQSSEPARNDVPTAPICGGDAPSSAPDLFQLNAGKNKVKLYYVPAGGSVSSYYIAYGREQNHSEYGTEYSQGPASGVLAFEVNLLAPNTTYYFRVRAGNGCMTSSWSREMKIRTTSVGQNTVYAY